MWLKNPEIWSLDSTYKVNRFDLPLLQISDVTCLHSTFNIGYCLLDGEREECFEWLLRVMKELLNSHTIPEPNVIISDYDKAFKKACRKVLNDGIQHQICLWHVMKNVAFNTKKKWIGTLEGTALGERGSDGSHIRDEDEPQPPSHQDPFDMAQNPASQDRISTQAAARFLNSKDRLQRLGDGVRDPHSAPVVGRAPVGQGARKWLPDADGILAAWSAVCIAKLRSSFGRNGGF
jgi:hypothetical protein